MRHVARTLFASLGSLLFVGSLGCDASPPEPVDDAGTTPDAASGLDATSAPLDDAYAGPPDAFDAGAGETGRMVGMTEAHNRFRRMAATDTPIPELVWDTEIAAVAQAYSERLAANGCRLMHSSNGYGENLYWQRGLRISAADVVARWHEEIDCYTYGPFMRGDACDATCIAAMNSNGCGHYTQVVWRDTRRLGCGMATCESGAEIWTCNYDPPGNYLGRVPY